VWETAKSISRSRKLAAFSGVSTARPAARHERRDELAPDFGRGHGHGIEPRVPQNLTRMPASGGIERGQGRRRDLGEALADRREHVEDHREARDVEDLLDVGLQRGDAIVPPWALACLEASISTPEPTLLMYSTPARSMRIRSWPRGAAGQMRSQRRLEALRLE